MLRQRAQAIARPQLAALASQLEQLLRPHQAFAASSSSVQQRAASLAAAVILERLPVVAPEDPAWEREYLQWQASVRARTRKQLAGEFLEDRQGADEAAGGPSASWQPAPRTTSADAAGDRRSLRRRLDSRLVLLLKSRAPAAGKPEWGFPRAAHAEAETIRQTAERALAGALSGGFEPYFVGNAPAGHLDMGPSRGQLFFHRCQLISGQPALPAGSAHGDYAWVAKDELGDYVKDEGMLSLLQAML